MEDLSLSAEDARAIGAAIKNEIKLLTGLLHRRGDDSLASSSNGVRVLGGQQSAGLLLNMQCQQGHALPVSRSKFSWPSV